MVDLGDSSAAETLPEYLRPGLDIIFAGYNPGERSAMLGHYYAGFGNLFWPLLYESGLTPVPLSFGEDRRILEFNYGLTDLVKRPSRSSADLRPEEMRRGAGELEAKLMRYQPRIVCFNGKGVYEHFRGGQPCELGGQAELIGRSKAFVIPSTSARNGRVGRERKLEFFRDLRRRLLELKQAAA